MVLAGHTCCYSNLLCHENDNSVFINDWAVFFCKCSLVASVQAFCADIFWARRAIGGERLRDECLRRRLSTNAPSSPVHLIPFLLRLLAISKVMLSEIEVVT